MGNTHAGIEDNNANFLLDMLISKVIGHSGIKDSTDFILNYRLSEDTAEKVMDEVIDIQTRLDRGETVTVIDALTRIAELPYTDPIPSGPEFFVESAFRVWAPGAWDRLKKG
jgi:hypothetical protein